MNIDENDVSKHELVKDWWDINGSMMGLHAMNPLRLSLICNGLQNFKRLNSQCGNVEPNCLNGIKVIDVGCGVGILCEPLAKLGAEVTGIDPSQKLISIAKEHATDNLSSFKIPPTYVCSNIEDHSLNNSEKYDILIASEVIEHVPDKKQFLDACLKTVKPGGSIFLTTPNRTVASWFVNIVVAERILKLLPKGIHDWNKFIKPRELQKLLHTSSCDILFINGMMFNVMNHKWFWSQFTLFHYAIHAVKTNNTL